MAGSSKVNNFTNWLASMTQGKFVDRVPLTGNAARETADLLAKELKYGNAQNLIKRMPVIQRGHMITQMMRLLLTRGRALPLTKKIAANSGGEIPGQFAQRLFGGGAGSGRQRRAAAGREGERHGDRGPGGQRAERGLCGRGKLYGQ